MSSKFLGGDGAGADLNTLADGTFAGNMASLKLQDLTPGVTLRANADKKIVSTQIGVADLDFVPLSNPFEDGDLEVTAGNVVALDVETSVIPTLNAFVTATETALVDNGNDITALEGKTQYQSAVANITSFAGDIGTTLTPSLDTFASDTESSLLGLSTSVSDLEDKTQNQTAVAGTTTWSGRVRATRIGGPTAGTDLIVDDNLDLGNGRSVTRAAAVQAALVQVDTLQTGSSGVVTLNSNIEGNSKDILNIATITASTLTADLLTTGSINGVVQVRSAADLPTPAAGFHPLAAGTQYIIVGAVTLTNGLDFSAGGCAVTGIDMGAGGLTFDESAADITGFYCRQQNVYVSNLTIIGGGGHFANGVVGLFDCENYNVAAPAPFYGRNRRFRVQSCNILSARRLGDVTGFGTLNVNNNFINGGGAAPSGVYTVEGFKFSDGLSLELIGNKVVLFAGSQIANTGALVTLKANADALLGFNAVVIDSNIIHPRNQERGILFEAGSTTQLGTIAGCTLIRTGGTAPLIDYPGRQSSDTYNSASVINYTISSNAGVTESLPFLKSVLGTLQTFTNGAGSTRIAPLNNLAGGSIPGSVRWAVKVDCSNQIQAFVPGALVTDGSTGNTALVHSVKAFVGAAQTIYLTDFSGAFNSGPYTTTNGQGFATTGLVTAIYKYCEKDPRKLLVTASITTANGSVGTDVTLGMGNGSTVDTDTEQTTTVAKLNSPVSLTAISARTFEFGDLLDVYVSVAGSDVTVSRCLITCSS